MILLNLQTSKRVTCSAMFVLLHIILLFGSSEAASIRKGCTSGEISELKVHCNSESSYLVLCSESTQAEVEIRITYSKRVFHINDDVGLPMEILWNSGMHNKALVRIGFAPKQYTYIMTARELQITVTNNASIYYIMCNSPINQCGLSSDANSQFSYDPPYFALDSSIENTQTDFVGSDTEFICSEDSYGHHESKRDKESADGEYLDDEDYNNLNMPERLAMDNEQEGSALYDVDYEKLHKTEGSGMDNARDDMEKESTVATEIYDMKSGSVVDNEDDKTLEEANLSNDASKQVVNNRDSKRPSSYISLLAMLLGSALVTLFLVFILLSLIKCYYRRKRDQATTPEKQQSEKEKVPLEMQSMKV